MKTPENEPLEKESMSLTHITFLLTWVVPVIVVLCIEILVQTRRTDRTEMREFEGPR
jgi:hypothetical protein